MAKFIKVTETRRGLIAVNLDIIEVMAPSANGGTELISITHHTKYTVKESMDDILHFASTGLTVDEDPDVFINRFIEGLAQETPPVMEVENNEAKL